MGVVSSPPSEELKNDQSKEDEQKQGVDNLRCSSQRWCNGQPDWYKENVITELGNAITKETKQTLKNVIVSVLGWAASPVASGKTSAK